MSGKSPRHALRVCPSKAGQDVFTGHGRRFSAREARPSLRKKVWNIAGGYSATLLAGLALIAALAAAGSAFGQAQPRTTSERYYLQARKVLDAAVKASGGLEALQGVKDVLRVGSGTAYNQGQSLKPDGPYTTRTVEVTSLLDRTGGRSYTETATTPQGALPARNRVVLKGDSGFTANLVTNVVTPMTAGAVAAAKAALRRDPSLLLTTALSRAETLRWLGEALLDGEKHEVITFADADGTQVGLYFNAQTALVTRSETLADHPILGDTLTELVFSDYRNVDGLRLPFRVVTRVAGGVTLDLKYSEIRINTGPGGELFDAPRGAAQATPAGPPTHVVVTKLAEDVYLAGGSSHNSLFIAFGDHVVVVEAPQSEERTQAVMAKIAETLPNRPIRYVVPTHYHFDHTGGLRGYIAKGVTVVTTPVSRRFIDRLAATPHTIRPDSLSRDPRKVVLERFTEKRVFSDELRRVEIYELGPNPHVEEAVIAYLPKEKILFVADLFSIPADGPIPPASPAAVGFAEKVRRLGLEVERIVPGHGRVGTMEDLRKALEARPAPR